MGQTPRVPELPEVETNARNLARWAIGLRITDVRPPPGARERAGLDEERFVARLVGRVIERVDRRGKWVLVALSGGAGLALHFGMTGKLARVARAGDEEPRFTRATIALEDGSTIAFVDARRFGKLGARERLEEIERLDEIASIGPDALGPDAEVALARALAGSARTVKDVLLDQRAIAGVGNLYATEALWLAGVHPESAARAFAAEPDRVRALAGGVRRALEAGLAMHAAREVPFYIEEGGPNPSRVYGHEGDPCPRCATRIATIRQSGRTTAYCPRSQRPARARRRARA